MYLLPAQMSPFSKAVTHHIDWHGIAIVCSHLPSVKEQVSKILEKVKKKKIKQSQISQQLILNHQLEKSIAATISESLKQIIEEEKKEARQIKQINQTNKSNKMLNIWITEDFTIKERELVKE